MLAGDRAASAQASFGKPAIVVQGGGMRGVYSMGALLAISEMPIAKEFRQAFGSSAGAMNAAFLLADQTAMAVSVYVDDISNASFINPLRVRKMVDIDYLIDDVLTIRKPLDIAAVKAAQCTLHIALTDAYTGRVHYVTNHDTDIDLMEALRATAAMPVLYNRLVHLGDGLYFDGGTVEPVPLIPAIAAGCNPIVVVITRPYPVSRARGGWGIRCAETLFLRSFPPATRHPVTGLETSFGSTLEAIEQARRSSGQPEIVLIHPDAEHFTVTRTTRSRSTLIRNAYLGWRDARKAFGLATSQETFCALLEPYLPVTDVAKAISAVPLA